MTIFIDFYPVQWSNIQGKTTIEQKQYSDILGTIRTSEFHTTLTRLGVHLQPDSWQTWYVRFDGYATAVSDSSNLEVGRETRPHLFVGVRAGIENVYSSEADNGKGDATFDRLDSTSVTNQYAFGLRATFDRVYENERYWMTSFFGYTRTMLTTEKDAVDDRSVRRTYSGSGDYVYVGGHIWWPVSSKLAVGSSAELGYLSEKSEVIYRSASSESSYRFRGKFYSWHMNLFQFRLTY